MRLIHSARLTALLAPLILANPLAAQARGDVTDPAAARASGNGSTVVVWPRHIQTLQARLDSFAVALPAEERALWNGVLVRAANAPTPAAGEVRVTPVLEIGPGGGCEVGPGGGCEDSPGITEAANRAAIIVQGGRTAGASGIVVQGGRTAPPAAGIVVQGGRTSGAAAPATTGVGGRPGAQGAEVRRPTEAAAIGRKLQPVPWLASESLGRRLAELSSRLPAEERGVLNWLLTRAAAAEVRPEPAGKDVFVHHSAGRVGTPGGLPPGAQAMDGFWWPPLPRALGIDARASGRTEERWILRF